MEKFKNAVEDLIGIQLTDEETILLYSKYKYRGSKLLYIHDNITTTILTTTIIIIMLMIL